MSRMRIALVTSAGFPEPHWHDADLPLLAERLRALGVRVEAPEWDGAAAVEWRRFDALVVQSPWSMWRSLPAWRRWVADRVAEGATLLNPADVLLLGSDKRYLAGLAAAGVPVVPTVVYEPGRTGSATVADVAAMLPEQARRTVVVKPVAAGGALDAQEFADAEAAVRHVAWLHGRGSAAIVQPYVEAIDTHRELGVLTLEGAVSHAITKAAILRPGDAGRAFHPDPRPHTRWADGQREVVAEAYAALCGLLPEAAPTPLSVRLDFIVDPSAARGLLLLEVELVAPVKFFGLFPEACERYAAAIVSRAS